MRSLFVGCEGERSPWRSWHILYASPCLWAWRVGVGGLQGCPRNRQRDTALKQSCQDSAELFAAEPTEPES